jgi:hypothetical protein
MVGGDFLLLGGMLLRISQSGRGRNGPRVQKIFHIVWRVAGSSEGSAAFEAACGVWRHDAANPERRFENAPPAHAASKAALRSKRFQFSGFRRKSQTKSSMRMRVKRRWRAGALRMNAVIISGGGGGVEG